MMHRRARRVFSALAVSGLLLFVLAAAAPRAAHAGACEPCTTNAECGGGSGVCVEWIGTPACASAPRSCCPGQGCALMGGTPSCIATGRCRLPTSGGDAGPGDAGGNTDASTPPADGATGNDAATGGNDASSAGDAATSGDGGTMTMAGGGCGCRVHGGGDARGAGGAAAVAGMLVAALGVAARRRRRQRASDEPAR